ncbi:hypothetical protein CR513_42844, partial [Mucuna pruriens]
MGESSEEMKCYTPKTKMMISANFPTFLEDNKPDAYLDWEMKIEQLNMRKPPCETWTDLKRELRDRFVPSYHARDLYVKLQRLYQGSNSVKEHHKEMKMCMIRTQIMESQEVIMARVSQPLGSLTLVIVGEVRIKVVLKRTRVLRREVELQKGENRRELHHHLIPLDLVVSNTLSVWERDTKHHNVQTRGLWF